MKRDLLSKFPELSKSLAKLIRLLASDVDGECLAAARALDRTLRSAGYDLHDLAAVVEAPATAPDADHDHFDGDDDETELPWQRMVDACTDQFGFFTSKEQQFLRTMQRWRGTPTPKQWDWLVALYGRVREAA